MNKYTDITKTIIKDFVDRNELPGACFAYVDQNGYECDFYGHKALIPQVEPLSIDTIYDIASLSKVVSTSTLIGKLMEEGLINFETKVADILPEFPYKDISVFHLITHTSGLPADDKNYKQCKSRKELWDFLLRLPLHNPTGTVVEYSCFGYIVLGKIIEHFKGSIEDFAKKVLFEPLGSQNIMYNPYLKGRSRDCAPTEVTEQRGVIQGVVHDGKANILEGLSGNAGIFSDIDTLARFVSMMLSDGAYNGKQILSKETMKLFHKTYTEGLNELRTMGGWFHGDKNTSAGPLVSADSLYHTGFTGTSIYIDFERGFGLVLLTNAVHPKREHKMNIIRPLVYSEVIKAFDSE